MERKLNFDKALEFLVKSIDAKTGGSRGFYSRLMYPLRGWSLPYPETSGYIIETLLNISRLQDYEWTVTYALRMADWIISLQDKDGSLPAGLYNPERLHEKSIFNTGQMMIGLLSAYKYTSNIKYLNSANAAADWIVGEQKDDGTWEKYHYKKNFFPSYYTRVVWPLLETALLTGNERTKNAAIKTLDFIAGKTLPNGFVRDCGFVPNTYAFLHTICYTIRGFLESYLLTENKAYFDIAYNLAHKLMINFEIKKRLAAAYYEDFKGVYWYRCLTGEAQICIIWLRLYNITSDARFINASSKLLDSLCATQPLKHNLIYGVGGGIKGSEPYWGRYISLRQPNWATKFFLDALLLEEEAYRDIYKKMKTGTAL